MSRYGLTFMIAGALLGTVCAFGQPTARQSASPPAQEPAPAEAPLADAHPEYAPRPMNPNLPTLFLIGDSTVRNGQGNGGGGQWGWGEPIADYFDLTKINVVNNALGGTSSRTFYRDRWENTRSQLKKGDFVIMQFGHNDGAPLDDPSRARGTIKGSGDETQEIDNPITKKHEVVHSFGWYLKKYVSDTREQGATPIICSLIPRKIWKDGKVVRNSADYQKWAMESALAARVPYIDLNEIIAIRYDKMGEAAVEPMFADPHTHTSMAGAKLNAECVISGLKALPDDPLELYLNMRAAAIPPYRP